jgi:hypothetical protein
MEQVIPMVRIAAVLVAAALVSSPMLGVQAPEATRVTSPVRLFDGQSLQGWTTWLKESQRADPKGVFGVRDGVLRISGEDWGGIATTGAFRDYRLVVEWKWGDATWGERKAAARDSGILVHGVGDDGAASGVWLESIEAQIIEGGTGDLILVAGAGKPSFTVNARMDGDQSIWDASAAAIRMTSGRLNWFGRDPAWKDVLGFRGARDVEKPAGEWNRQEVVAEGASITSIVNGVTVAKATACSHTAGRIQIQSEGAEILVRRVELQPLDR